MRNPWRASGERMSQTKRLETIHPLVNIDNLAGKSIHDGPKAILVFSLNRLPGLLRLPRRLKRKELKRKRCNGPRKQLMYSWMDLLGKVRNRDWRVPVTHSSPSAARLHSQSPQAPGLRRNQTDYGRQKYQNIRGFHMTSNLSAEITRISFVLGQKKL